MKKRLLGILLSFALMLTMLPVLGLNQTSYADGTTYNPASTYIYFGDLDTYNTEVTISGVSGKAWYVIHSLNSSTVTLLSKESFGNHVFNSELSAGNVYTNSEIKTYVDGLTGEGQPLAGISSVISDLTLLDIPLAQVLSETKRKGAGTDWWLYSSGNEATKAAFVNGGSGGVSVDGDFVNQEYGVRPAFTLDLSKVEFDSSTKTFSVIYPLWVGGTQVTSANKDDVFNDQKVSYTPATDTSAAILKLNGYSYSGEGYNKDAIHAEENLIIETSGTNNVENTSTANGTRAIGVTGNLTFQGSGTLNATGGYRSIVANSVTIESGTVNISGGKYGIYASSGEDGNITINGGIVNASGEQIGIQAANDLIIKKGTVIATGSNAGIGAMAKNLTIEDGAVNARGGQFGIQAANDLIIKKGTVKATGSNDGVGALAKNLTIENGMIEATGNIGIGGVQPMTIDAGTVKATGTVTGIYANSGLTIKGGTVEATASADGSYGISAYFGDVIIHSGKVIASGKGAAIVSQYGTVTNDIKGTGWTNTAGSAGKADIAVGNHASEELSSYKKVQFPAAPISAKPVLAAKGIVKGRKAVKISWNSVSGATRYEVYFSRCNANGKKYTPKFKGSTTGNSMKIRKLRKGRCYKFYVVAKDSKGNVVSQSLVGHFIAGNVKGKRTNAKSLTLGASSVSLSKGAAYKITAKQKKVRKGKKLLNSGHAQLLRYVSDNPSVATVDGSGNIKAVDAGTCTVYVQTVNGIWKTVAVTVK